MLVSSRREKTKVSLKSSRFFWFIETTGNDDLSIKTTQEIEKVAEAVDVRAGWSPQALEFHRLSLSFLYEIKMKLDVSGHFEDI